MYTTSNFAQGLINSVINFMKENNVEVFPLDFLANRNDYHSCEFARIFYNHGYRYFTVNENNELVLHGVWDYLGEKYVGQTFEWIIVPTQPGYEPETIHHCILAEDLIALIQIAYDTIGSVYFPIPGRDVEECIKELEEIEELEESYEARRNEVA